jgi:hypothetical protein
MSRQYRMERSSKRFLMANANSGIVHVIPPEILKVSNDLAAFQWNGADR